MPFTLAHLSDVHLGPLPSVKPVHLFSKRVTGYINWRRNRAAHITSGTLATLVNELDRAKPDHIAVTGDLTNLALEEEIANAAVWLQSLGPADAVTAVPGNHDAYVPGALDRAVSAWKVNMQGEDFGEEKTDHDFPFIRVREPVAVIGVNSAVATAPFMASGRLSSRQAKGLERELEKAGEKGLFRVVLIHHPPVRNATKPQKRLYGIKLFHDAVKKHGAELVLHGHTHLPQRNFISGPEGRHVPVIGVPAGGQGPGHGKPPGAFNLFHIEGEAGAWSCRFEEHSVTGQTGLVKVTHSRWLHGDPAEAVTSGSGNP